MPITSFPQNYFQQVSTFNRSFLALQKNSYVAMKLANLKFKDFNTKIGANLGQSMTFDVPPPMYSNNGLVASFQGLQQIPQTLTVSQSQNVAYAVTDPQRIFNVDKPDQSYMEVFGKSAHEVFGTVVESDMLAGAISNVIIGDINSPSYGLPDTTSGPYRFFGDGITPLSTYQQYQQAVVNLRTLGDAGDNKIIIPIEQEPVVIGTGLNQFAPKRNNEIAMSWELGNFGRCEYYTSNLLPVHYSGNAGINQNVLTVISVNDPTGAAVTTITCSGASTTDIDAIKAGDLARFLFNVSGQTNIFALVNFGNHVTSQPVQFRITANAGSDGSGHVVLTILPALCWVAGQNQNISSPITAGMQIKLLPSHQAGLLMTGNAFYAAMPRLPDQMPYPTNNEMTDEGISARLTWGTFLGQAEQGLIHDGMWGSTMVPKYFERLIYPILT